MITLRADESLPNTGGWQDRHNAAVARPRGAERGILGLIRGWVDYALCHRERYESLIGDDGVLGEYWKDAGSAIKGLLDGDVGRLDCGTLSAYICNFAEQHGIDPEEL